jgi:chromate transporter
MARTLTPDWQRGVIGLAAVVILMLLGGATGQIVAIVIGGVAGLRLCRTTNTESVSASRFPISRRAGSGALVLFLLLLAGLPLASMATGLHGIALLDAFYRAGAFVFGGGHVVLPLIEEGVVQPGWIDSDGFLAGYGAAQAVPGPLFTFAAYLGAVMGPSPNGLAGAALCLVAIFAPGLLLVTGVLPFWGLLRGRPAAQAAMRGANAAVVGILTFALYTPVGTSAILSPIDFFVALTGFVLLTLCKCPPWIVVALTAASGVAFALI